MNYGKLLNEQINDYLNKLSILPEKLSSIFR